MTQPTITELNVVFEDGTKQNLLPPTVPPPTIVATETLLEKCIRSLELKPTDDHGPAIQAAYTESIDPGAEIVLPGRSLPWKTGINAAIRPNRNCTIRGEAGTYLSSNGDANTTLLYAGQFQRLILRNFSVCGVPESGVSAKNLIVTSSVRRAIFENLDIFRVMTSEPMFHLTGGNVAFRNINGGGSCSTSGAMIYGDGLTGFVMEQCEFLDYGNIDQWTVSNVQGAAPWVHLKNMGEGRLAEIKRCTLDEGAIIALVAENCKNVKVEGLYINGNHNPGGEGLRFDNSNSSIEGFRAGTGNGAPFALANPAIKAINGSHVKLGSGIAIADGMTLVRDESSTIEQEGVQYPVIVI